MYFTKTESSLTAKQQNETILIEAWGVNALRVRVTHNPAFTGQDNALSPAPAGTEAQIEINDSGATVVNGRLRCFLSCRGFMEFYRDDTLLLKEYSRDWRNANEHSPSMRFSAREFKPLSGSNYGITLRFEANEGEKLYGMGQYQQPNLDLKGCVLELAQRNSQISIPFCLSSKGYGFLWNNPGIGEVMFGANYTQWHSAVSEEIDYWITTDDTPRQLMEHYTAVTGRAPQFPDNALGLWQCKLRYRTQEEVLQVAREYKRRGIPLDVIVIDFFHWVRQGDWSFDSEYWPDPLAMVKELKEMGIRCMVSIWPTVDKKSVHFREMLDRGLLVQTEYGATQCFDFQGDTMIYDATNPEARQFIWEKAKKNYYDYGIDMFWLDEAEPEYSAYDFENFRYYAGQALKVSNCYPREHAKAFYEGMQAQGQTDIVNLLRCAWVGSQKYATLVWSGDVKSNFTSLRDQLSAGLNIGMAGIPWWVSDTGGFFGDVREEHFNELLIRWFQFSTFCPVLRMHGDRGPHDIPNLSNLDYGGGFSATGRPNELWSYGEKVYRILKKYLDIRLGMKEYIKSVLEEASRDGSPVLRTLFYEFPGDETCWNVTDQYMFGPKYLVAPVLYQGMTSRQVYLPQGSWRSIHDGQIFSGPAAITAEAPLDIIPVYEKI